MDFDKMLDLYDVDDEDDTENCFSSDNLSTEPDYAALAKTAERNLELRKISSGVYNGMYFALNQKCILNR